MRPNFYLTCIILTIVAINKSGGTSRQRCHDEEFTCKNGECIRLSYICDGDNDCEDSSDEVNCDSESCSRQQFKCISGGGCIHPSGVCNLTAECLDGSDEFNCPGKAPQEKWEEHWLDHRENLTLAHADDNVVLYFDSQTNSSITWPFEIVSKAWKYVKKTYWSFEPDPRLFVILHTQKHGECHMNSYLHERHGHRNVLDCGRPSGSSWDRNTSSNALTLLTNFGAITRLGAKAVFQDADFEICGHYLQDIVSYDVYTHVLGQTAGINAWKEHQSSQQTNGHYCFRDWALPIYEKYGGSLVLERFYSLTYLYGVHSYGPGFQSFSMAQFIHFWSGAAQADLTSLAYTAFDWFNDGEMKKERQRHPQFSYPVTSPNATSYWNVSNDLGISRSRRCQENEFRCQNRKCVSKRHVCDGDNDCGDLSDEVEVECRSLCRPNSYFTCGDGGCIPLRGVCNSTKECADGSDEFNCAGKTPELKWEEHWHDHKENLTLAHADDHVVVYYDSNTNQSIEWPFSVLSEAWKYAKVTYGSFGPDPSLFVIFHTDKHNGCHTNSFLGERHGHRNVIDCGLPNGGTWESPSATNIKNLLTTFGHVIQGGAKGVLQNADVTICNDLMREIISYDIYIHLRGDTDEILPWKNEKLSENWNDRFCFKNWFLPIYEKYGGASVLNEFYYLTNVYGTRAHGGIDFVGFNMPEFIHFWSGAARADLAPLANTSFGWENDHEMILTRQKYPGIIYPLSQLGVISTTTPGNAPSSTGPTQPPISESSLGGSSNHSNTNTATVLLSTLVFALIVALMALGVKYHRLKKYPNAGSMFSASWSALPFQRLRRTNPLTINFQDPPEEQSDRGTTDINRII